MNDLEFEEFQNTWSDTTPVEAKQDPDGIFGMQYSEQYKYIMGIFRAALNKMELSQRALKLTEIIATKNPSNIAVWWYRQEILKAIGYSWEEEMDFLDQLTVEQVKPYQLWNHRKFLDDRCETVPDEKKRLFKLIACDNKNFHAYSFFIWFIERWGVYDYFLDYTKDLLHVDKYNNSALSFRFWIVQHKNLNTEEELKYVLELMARDYQNESAANYIRGLMKLNPSLVPTIKETFDKIVVDHHFKEIYSLLYTIACIQNDKETQDKYCDLLIELDTYKAQYWTLVKNHAVKNM
ncbi:prenyltransferase alpha subunit, putative [Trichomonas vaginalis G3]|uniref:Protein farnesyltransferase/geranylgeranyltransferase type-1 subunit alpha n=1 Tax=Trichomonas vaginalis (strain ATCC PRA-98 / G3) TaxID=412133 RepID=A2EDY3_TRIV3|nr:CAAX-protein geranylgeranyltransferase protein [Trichomonas vaginalis G3]EAY09095.1 prenyltransferase alpha subunit, putative [Trichomonas vaginalis G3]KAI5502673.1 CAAX-protein geranylgeranyltransferase protein [Trichomonas vaginalis G3]|eukprot:XP_001321318.1 prenyltransferase alpha subunit [Trichomonas vaginalis G3]